MKSRNKGIETTRIEVVNDETSDPSFTDTTVSDSAPAPLDGLGRQQLIDNYQALIKQRAIFYPVVYRVIRELGRGRQGIVFLCLRQGSRGCITRHAIKIFDPGIYSSAKKYWTDMGRIASQISRLQTAHSPNLVDRDIYEESNGIGYIQMEAIDGVDLRYLLSGDHLEQMKEICTPEEWAKYTDVVFRLEDGKVMIQPGIAVYIMRMVLRGLETLHEKNFVHSDIKPANIMIDRLGYVKVVDFGRAIMANEKLNILLGSPMYMAPELHRREPSTFPSDIYSIGLVGLEMLRGEPPINPDVNTESDLLEQKLSLHERLDDLLPEHVRQNEQLVELLRRFLQPERENRFQDAVSAESGGEGLRIVHKQLTQSDKDTDYGRELGDYMSRLTESWRDQTEREIFYE